MPPNLKASLAMFALVGPAPPDTAYEGLGSLPLPQAKISAAQS
jgi:hypothetical protein